MKAGLLVNPHLRNAGELAGRARDIIGERFETVLEKDTAGMLGERGVPIAEMNVDFLVTFGGDGTFLWTFQRTDVPILAVNMGIVGFLAESTMDDLARDLDTMVRGDFRIEERLKLAISAGERNVPDAVNEGVIHTAHVAKIRKFEITVDGFLFAQIRADGIIVATPTGSTCYALSAGSPILDPRTETFVITPLAPYKLATRPLVVPATSDIAVSILDDEDCVLVVDGQSEFPLRGETVRFTMSRRRAKFVRFDGDVLKFVRNRLPV